MNDHIKHLIEGILGKYDQEVEIVIWNQIREIVKTTGKFDVDDWVLQIVRPTPTMTSEEGYHFVTATGAVRLYPKSALLDEDPELKLQQLLLRGETVDAYNWHLYLDGKKIKHVQKVNVEVEAQGIATATIVMKPMKFEVDGEVMTLEKKE